MLPKFTVSSEDGESYTRVIAAIDAEDAAETWARKTFSDRDYTQEDVCIVVDADGRRTRWTISTEVEPVFFARKDDSHVD